MPTRKLPTVDPLGLSSHCSDPEHEPPLMQAFSAGVYEHTCPKCRHVTIFRIDATVLLRRSGAGGP
jgi:hypothetical protein